jgi:hypothetical protein
MGMRRMTRLTNAFSKKVENLEHAVALHFMHYNFCRVHSSLRVTPAMEAGVSDHVWSLEEGLVRLICVKRLGPTLLVIVGTSLVGYSVGLLIFPFVCPLPPPPPPDNLSDWSQGHLVVEWPKIVALIVAPLIAGVGLIVWGILRKRA